MGYRNVSLPTELVNEIEEKKPKWMSIAEYVRHAVYFYMRTYKDIPDTILKEVPVLE